MSTDATSRGAGGDRAGASGGDHSHPGQSERPDRVGTADSPGRDASTGRGWHLAVPAIISVVTFLVIDLALATLVGRPWGPAYPLAMDALVLLRMGPLFLSGVVVWPAMRARGATRGQALLGIWATPVAFALVSAWRAADFFPPLQAAYYATNPMVIGALGAQVAGAGVGALAWGLWRARRGHTSVPGTSGSTEHPPGTGWSWGPVIAIVAGTAVTVFAVIWDGGQHLFYPWVLLYGRLFG